MKAEKPAAAEHRRQQPTVTKLIEQYLAAQKGLKAESTLGTERTHLKNLQHFLGDKAELPVGQVDETLLDSFTERCRC